MLNEGEILNIFQFFRKQFLMICCLCGIGQLYAQDADSIMLKVDHVERFSYNSSVRTYKVSTCKYITKNGAMKCTEKPRVLTLQTIHKDYGETDRDVRSLDVVLEPIRDKGMCLLTYSYFASGKDTEIWIYMPALSKIKKMVSSSQGSETGSVFGSEFSMEDAVGRKYSDYTYKYIKEGTFDKRPVWVIESLPTEERKKKSYYSKIVSWIDKERFIILKENKYDRHGKLYKQLTNRNIEKVDGVWIVKKNVMNNISSKKVSSFEVIKLGLNVEIDDEFLTQRPLEDFTYREKNLAKYREYMK